MQHADKFRALVTETTTDKGTAGAVLFETAVDCSISNPPGNGNEPPCRRLVTPVFQEEHMSLSITSINNDSNVYVTVSRTNTDGTTQGYVVEPHTAVSSLSISIPERGDSNNLLFFATRRGMYQMFFALVGNKGTLTSTLVIQKTRNGKNLGTLARASGQPQEYELTVKSGGKLKLTQQ